MWTHVQDRIEHRTRVDDPEGAVAHPDQGRRVRREVADGANEKLAARHRHHHQSTNIMREAPRACGASAVATVAGAPFGHSRRRAARASRQE